MWDYEEPGLWGTEGTFYTNPRKECQLRERDARQRRHGVLVRRRLLYRVGRRIHDEREEERGGVDLPGADAGDRRRRIRPAEREREASEAWELNGDGRSEEENWREQDLEFADGMNADFTLTLEKAEGAGWAKPEAD